MFNPFGWLRIPTAEAHCDIPCGIYDPIAAKIAAQTVHKMVLRIQSLEPMGSCLVPCLAPVVVKGAPPLFAKGSAYPG